MSIPVTLRTVKGDTLTFAEMDGNFSGLANATVRLTAGGTVSNIVVGTGTDTGITIANSATVQATLTGNTLTFASNITQGNINLGGNYLSNVIFENVREKVFALGTVNNTVSIDGNNGSIQTMTAASNITINTNNLSNFLSGETVSLVITQGTNANLRVLTSNILFAGGSKTLSTANAAVDTVHITYDGTLYLAALVKGYA